MLERQVSVSLHKFLPISQEAQPGNRWCARGNITVSGQAVKLDLSSVRAILPKKSECQKASMKAMKIQRYQGQADDDAVFVFRFEAMIPDHDPVTILQDSCQESFGSCSSKRLCSVSKIRHKHSSTAGLLQSPAIAKLGNAKLGQKQTGVQM